jgi:hypothetical protein
MDVESVDVLAERQRGDGRELRSESSEWLTVSVHVSVRLE